MNNRRLAALAAGLVAAITAIVLLATLADNNDKPTSKPETVTVKVDGVDKGTSDDKTIVAPAAAVDALEDKPEATDLGDVGLSEGDKATPEVGVPLATQEFPGCRTQFVNNQSARTATPKLIVWHYTVSSDTPGWNDNNALTAMANRPANGVSWHFSIGRKDGNCAYNVPLTRKAWTQGNANSFSVGIEVIATGKEGTYVEGAGKQRLLEVTREIGRRLGIPMQQGAVSGCTPVRAGIIQHKDLGLCGGGHVDVTPFGYRDLVAELAKDTTPKPAPQRVTEQTRTDCRLIHAYRLRRAAGKPRTAEGTAAFEKRLARVAATRYRCVDGKPKRK